MLNASATQRSFNRSPRLIARPFIAAIVNERLARSLVPEGDVLGRRLRIGTSPTQPPHEIVGVVADARNTGTSLEAMNEIYFPYTQGPAFINCLIVRSNLLRKRWLRL